MPFRVNVTHPERSVSLEFSDAMESDLLLAVFEFAAMLPSSLAMANVLSRFHTMIKNEKENGSA